MLGLTESDLPPGAAVCSEHFRRSDFTVTNDGTIKLNKDSIPLQFCMMCLASGHSKMYPMNQNYLEKAYTSLTGIAVSYICDKINTQPRVCVECAQRLVNCDRFRNKGLRAYKLLMQILGNDKVLTSHNLKSINRVGKLLISNIAKHTFEPDHCDLYVNGEDNTIHAEEEYSSYMKRNIDMTRVKYEEKGATDFDVVHLSKLDNFENDVHADNDINNDNKLYNDDIKNAGIISYDVQVQNANINNDNNDDNTNNNDDNTNNNDDNTNYCDAGLTDNVAQAMNEDKDDNDNIIINSDVTNVTSNEGVVFMIRDSADEVKSLEDDIKHDSENDIDIDDDVEDCFGDNMNYYHNNGHSKNYVKLLNRLEDESKSENKRIVKDSRPIIQNKDLIPRTDKTNENLQFLRLNCDTKSKNINNAQTINNNNQIKIKTKERKENVKLNNSLSEVFQETKNFQNEDKNLKNVMQEIAKSNNHAPKKNGRQLSSKSKINKASVPKPKRQKEPKPCVPKPKKRNSNSKLFTKTILTYDEQLTDIQRRKHTEHYKLYPYKCDICFTGCWSLFTYNRHMDKHTDKYGKLECAICGVRQKTRTRLILHVQSHAVRYSCKQCNYVTGLSALVTNHARWHSGLAFKCPHCEAKFSKRTTYLSHLRLKHPSDCACPLCGFSFVSEHGVKTHIKLSHPCEDVQNLSGPSCEQCNVRFASEAAFDTHISVSPKHVSSGIPRRNKSTTKYKSLGLVQKSQRCRQDETICNNHAALCEICGKSFQNVKNLNQHLNVHAGVKYKCDLCSKSYLHRTSLKIHQQSAHSDSPKRYPCSVCHREFSFIRNRHRHMQTHNPTKRTWYMCDICNKSFTSLAAKVNHVAHVHNKVPWPKRHRPQRRARTGEYSEDNSDSHDVSDA